MRVSDTVVCVRVHRRVTAHRNGYSIAHGLKPRTAAEGHGGWGRGRRPVNAVTATCSIQHVTARFVRGGARRRAAGREPHAVPGAGAPEQCRLPDEGLRQGRRPLLRGPAARPQQSRAALQPVGCAGQAGPVRRRATGRHPGEGAQPQVAKGILQARCRPAMPGPPRRRARRLQLGIGSGSQVRPALSWTDGMLSEEPPQSQARTNFPSARGNEPQHVSVCNNFCCGPRTAGHWALLCSRCGAGGRSEDRLM